MSEIGESRGFSSGRHCANIGAEPRAQVKPHREIGTRLQLSPMIREWVKVRPHRDSNPDLSLRRRLFCPLNYGNKMGAERTLSDYSAALEFQTGKPSDGIGVIGQATFVVDTEHAAVAQVALVA